MSGRGEGLDEKRQNIYIALEEFNFIWDEPKIKDALYLWNEGYHITDIAKYMKRDADEVFILLFDQSRKGYLKARKGGLTGCFMQTED